MHFLIKLHSAHANGAMQCMTSLPPTHPKDECEGCNHIAISQRALLYRYLPHQSGYGFFICIKICECKCNVAMHELHMPQIYNFKGNASTDNILQYKSQFQNYLAGVRY